MLLIAGLIIILFISVTVAVEQKQQQGDKYINTGRPPGRLHCEIYHPQGGGDSTKPLLHGYMNKSCTVFTTKAS